MRPWLQSRIYSANMNFDRLRVVAELADVNARKEAVLATFMPEEPGCLKKFQQMV